MATVLVAAAGLSACASYTYEGSGHIEHISGFAVIALPPGERPEGEAGSSAATASGFSIRSSASGDCRLVKFYDREILIVFPGGACIVHRSHGAGDA